MLKRPVDIIVVILVVFLMLGTTVSCQENNLTDIGIEESGRWNYAFFDGYKTVPDIEAYADRGGGFMDAMTINAARINDKDYLILNFPSRSSQYNGRIFIFSVENPASPRFISSISPVKQGSLNVLINTVYVDGTILYGGLFGDRGLWMVDISNPARPRDLGIALLEMTSSLIVSGDYAYAVGQMYNGISIADVSDVQNAREVARINTDSRECRLALNGDLLFAGIGRTITVYDVSSPSSPTRVGEYELELFGKLSTSLPVPEPHEIHWGNWANIIDMQASGSYLYVAFGAGGMRVVDVSQPSSLKEVAAMNVGVGFFSVAVTLQDSYMYTTQAETATQQLVLISQDITTPENPGHVDIVRLESVFGFGGASAAYCWIRPQVVGNYVYSAGLNYLDFYKVKR